MLTYEVLHQHQYSRSELLLRVFFGWIYIGIPHGFLLACFGMILRFMTLAAFFVILFTGVTPKWYYEWTVQINRWMLRVMARLGNLADGYPSFWLDGKDDKSSFDLNFWQVGRGEMVLRTFLGWLYAGIPHVFVLYFRFIGSFFLMFFAFFAVLFTGHYPESWHRFNVGTMRWATRLGLYLCWLYKDYPPFSGKPDSQVGFEFQKSS